MFSDNSFDMEFHRADRVSDDEESAVIDEYYADLERDELMLESDTRAVYHLEIEEA